MTQNLVLEHSEEILNVNTIESTSPSRTRSTLSHDLVIQWTKAKVRVYSDSVLCLGKMSFHKGAITRWEGQEEELKMSASCGELLGIGGEAIEIEWNLSPGLTFRSVDLGQKHQVNCDLFSPSFVGKVPVTFLFQIFNSFLLHYPCFILTSEHTSAKPV